MYSNLELFEIIMIYAKNENYHKTAREFQRRFPNSPRPSPIYVQRLVRRLKNTGSLLPRRRAAGPFRTICDMDLDILGYFSAHPQTSIRTVGKELDISCSYVWRLLQRYNWHPYSLHGCQALLPTDLQRRLDFCNWALNQHAINPRFLRNVIWTDECHFSQDNDINRQNDHYWSTRNPMIFRETQHQKRFSVNVWCGIWDSQIIGPVMYSTSLTGERYHDMILSGAVEDFLEDIPLAVHPRIWFQHDGAPPHRRNITTNWLNTEFPNRWIGIEGPVEWPPRSPDLTPPDFYLWSRLRKSVYETTPKDVPELCSRISRACREITPEELDRVQNALVTRLQLCVGVDGGHFE